MSTEPRYVKVTITIDDGENEEFIIFPRVRALYKKIEQKEEPLPMGIQDVLSILPSQSAAFTLSGVAEYDISDGYIARVSVNPKEEEADDGE